MRSGGNSLSYNLYLNAARTTIWGDGSGGTSVHGPVAAPLLGSVTVNVFGRITARQNVGVGAYSDVIVATINY